MYQEIFIFLCSQSLIHRYINVTVTLKKIKTNLVNKIVTFYNLSKCFFFQDEQGVLNYQIYSLCVL